MGRGGVDIIWGCDFTLGGDWWWRGEGEMEDGWFGGGRELSELCVRGE